MAILSVQSHVAYGHVGNRSSVFPLELLGFDVWPINTVQFSNHAGYPSHKGEIFSHSHIDLVWSGIKDLGVIGECEAVLSGYLGDASIGHSILAAVSDVKAARPDALYCCDPVMGDYGGGVYVREGIEDFIGNYAIPAADIVTPNQFEAELISGSCIESLDDARKAADAIHEKGPRIVLITSFQPTASEAGSISIFLSEEGRSWTVTTPELPMDPAPNGAGDLTAALFLGQYLKTRSASSALELMADSVFSVFERTKEGGSRELKLVESRDAILSPARRFKAVEVGDA
jgi:pyridoxine kinase